jgi:addiction module HigA family antidote
MKNHPHPGRVVRQYFLEPLGLTVTEAAKVFGVARQTINNLVNEKAGISAEMAVRLSKAFGHQPRYVGPPPGQL